MSAAMLRRVVVALALLAGAAEAFVAPRASSRAPCALYAEDPTKVWYAEIANTSVKLSKLTSPTPALVPPSCSLASPHPSTLC